MASNGTGTEVFVANSLDRTRYFFGQLLTERDLRAEQAYHLRLQRLLQRETFGTGVVSGLAVTQQSGGVDARDGCVFVHAGLGLDPEGRELLLETDTNLLVIDPPLAPNTTPWITGTSKTDVAKGVQTSFQLAFGDGTSASNDDVQDLLDTLIAAGLLASGAGVADLAGELNKVTPPTSPPPMLEQGQTPVDYLFNELVGVTHVGIRYHEAETDLAPALLDAACCDSTACHATRTREGVVIVTSRQRFDVIADPFTDARIALEEQFLSDQATASDLGSLRMQCGAALCAFTARSWRPVPSLDPCQVPDLPVLPLARVLWSRFARDPRVMAVEDCRFGYLAPGLPAIRALVAELTQCHASLNVLPHVESVDPAFGGELVVASSPVEIRFRLSGEAQAPPAATWKLVIYPDAGGPSVTVEDGSPGPFTSANIGLDGSDSSVVVLTLSFSSSPPSGTYVASINFTGDEIEAVTTNAKLDGEPNPLTRVPSGNAQPGGVFHTTFFVR